MLLPNNISQIGGSCYKIIKSSNLQEIFSSAAHNVNHSQWMQKKMKVGLQMRTGIKGSYIVWLDWYKIEMSL